MNIILLGPPGSGKGTQAERLRNARRLTHIATGDLFRENLKNKTELGLLAQGYMNAGKLVPDDVTVAMLRERMLRPDVSPNGILFDGFPRTIAQADALRDLLSSLDKKVDAVIHLVVSDEELVSRLSGRLICRECQTPFHQVNNPFKSCPFNKCEGQYLYQRDDDKPETVRARLQTFHQQTSPLIDYYSQAGVLKTIAGEGAVDEVTQAMLVALGDV
ncbi:MAG: adenylate kinase [Chloroflexota bacterium]